MEDVRGRVAVITGAGSGIGRGMARVFADAGMKVVVADVRQEGIDATVADLTGAGHEAIGVKTDVSKLAEVEALAQAAMDHFGAVDVLCNNAGVGTFAPISAMSIEDWEWTLAIDLWGPIYGVKAFLPLMEKHGSGHINSTASVAGLVSAATLGPYNVAKHGVVALMCTLERELRAAKSNITTSVLCPGAVNTSIGPNSLNIRKAAAGAVTPTPMGAKANQRNKAALAGGADPDDVGRMVLDAIVSGHFWVLTDARMAKQQRYQVESMLEDRSLSRLGRQS